jgi:hypothetical protein
MVLLVMVFACYGSGLGYLYIVSAFPVRDVLFLSKTRRSGTGMTGMGTGLVMGTKPCIRIRTRGTPTRVPAGYIRTRVQH